MADSYAIGGKSYQSMDIDAANEYLYVAVLNDAGNPVVIKIAAALDADGVESYAPGDGSSVNVVCGDMNAGIVWACGDFGDTIKITRQLGNYWYQIDQNLWYSEVTPIYVGPEDDNVAMVVIKEEYKVYESYFLGDTGPYWLDKTPENDIPFQVGAFDRLSLIPEQLIIGVDAADPYWYSTSYWYPVVEYSPSEAALFYDITKNLDFVATITTVIYG